MAALNLSEYKNPRDMPAGMASLQAELGTRHKKWERAVKRGIAEALG